MTFHTEKSASRKRSKMEVVKMPPIMAPMYDIKVEIFSVRYFLQSLLQASTVIHSGIITMPFTATFMSGNSTW